MLLCKVNYYTITTTICSKSFSRYCYFRYSSIETFHSFFNFKKACQTTTTTARIISHRYSTIVGVVADTQQHFVLTKNIFFCYLVVVAFTGVHANVSNSMLVFFYCSEVAISYHRKCNHFRGFLVSFWMREKAK